MATVKDAPLALAGIIVGVTETTDYQTKQPNGAAVLISSPEGGYANVKLDLSALASIRPNFGDFVAWVVALSPYKLDGRDAQLSVRYVRDLTSSDIAALSSTVETAGAK